MTIQSRILVADDNTEMQTFLKKFLTHEGYEVITCSSAGEVLRLIESESESGGRGFDIVLSDVRMPQIDGLTLVERLRETRPDLPVILMTAYGSIEAAVEAMRKGAHDYLTKPFKLNDVKETLRRTLEYREALSRPVVPITDGAVLRDMNLIGQNQQMKEIYELARRVAEVNSTILILGESGTGKEVVAHAIHMQSPRKNKNFVAINCAAIPEELLESELFGHAKGSFTGATVQKKGLFEEAEGGTIFLDEIGDMPLTLQAKLLRVLQERKIRPVGSNQLKDIDVRIIAATHRDLRAAIIQHQFREDLFYRLSVIPIFIPPLRDRRDDIPLFADFFLRKYSAQFKIPVVGFTEAAMQKLKSLQWEGNVRQLENTVERAVILTQGRVIDGSDLTFLDSQAGESRPSVPDAAAVQGDLNLREIEKKAIQVVLQKTGGRKEKAARLLGISRKTLYRKEKEYGLA